MDFIAGRGFKPATVIDVGVAWGTPEIYDVFPDAYYVLVEPVPALEDALKSLMKQLRGEYHLCAAGSETGEVELIIPEGMDGSSIVQNPEWNTLGRRTIVPLRRLDDIVPANPEGPLLIKTDVQGADIDVIRGAERLLEAADVVVMEVQMFRAVGVYEDNQFTQVIEHMKSRGFVTYDVLEYLTRPRDGALGQLNLAFVKENGPFRAHHLWV